MTTTPSERDWTADFGDENGNYQNQCAECKELFIGHKRRCVCRACFNRINSTPRTSGTTMTPKEIVEIVERVKHQNAEGKAHCASLKEYPGQTHTAMAVVECAHIDHLLAIHAAVIVLFDAEVAYKAAAICEAPFDVSLARLSEAQERYRVARTNLAALCGWKAEPP